MYAASEGRGLQPSMIHAISVCRGHAVSVKRWRDGKMALRWFAAGMVDAGKPFRIGRSACC